MSSPARTAASPGQGLDLRRLVVGRGWPWVLVWVVSRGWMLHQWAKDYSFIANDVRYYYGQLGQSGGYPVILREYPLPVVWFLDLLRQPVAGHSELYVVVFAICMAVLDAGFSAWLWQRHSRVAALYWMAFVFAMGPLVWFRYDLLAGVVVGAAAFQVARRPALSGGLVALGAAIKLWPALLVAALLGRGHQARRRLVAFAATGCGLALLALASGGLARLLSPLTWQQDRGLQIESVWASVPMWLRAFGDAGRGDSRYLVQMSPYNAFEVYGPQVTVLLQVASVAMALGVAFAALVGLLAARRGTTPPHVRALAMVSIVVAMIVANKTLSPQYMAWLGAVVAAWIGLVPRGRERARAGAVAVVCLLLAALTQYVYPGHYGPLISGLPAGPGPTRALVLRNLALLALCPVLCVWTVLALSGRGRIARSEAGTDTIDAR